MPPRLVLLTVFLVLGVVLAGCGMQPTTGHLTGMAVTEAPPDAEIIAVSDDRIAEVDAVQSVVEQAAQREGEMATVELSGRDADRTIDQLEKLPYYDNESSEYRSGWYIEYQTQVVVVELAVQE